MTYRLTDLEIPADDPFRHDVLQREPLVTFLSQFILGTEGPFVLALDGPWGTGKTTLIRMLKAQLEIQGANCVHFDAWKVDFATDPLVALISAVEPLKEEHEAFGGHLATVRKVTSLIARRAMVVGVKALTVGALDFEKETEEAIAAFTGDVVSDIVDGFTKERELVDTFRIELEHAVKSLPTSEEIKPPLIIFIDELDRCRPNFAIELLERIKHLFDVSGILFVLSLDKQQLNASTSAVYGQGIDSEEYLRRFIDLEYRIPKPSSESFTEYLFKKLELDQFFDERTAREIAYDKRNYVDSFNRLAEITELSLRARERCMTRFKIVMEQTKSNQYLDPILVAFLIVIRSKMPKLFYDIITGDADHTDVFHYFESLPGGKHLKNESLGAAIEAYLVAADPDRRRAQTHIENLRDPNNGDEYAKQRGDNVIRIYESINNGFRDGISMEHVASKIDLAARLQS